MILPLPELQLQDAALVPSVKAYLQQVRERILEIHETRGDSALLYRTEAIDRLLVALYQVAERLFGQGGRERRYALVSQGGYGRGELCLCSDIDLLFLYDGKGDGFIQHLTHNVLQILWDAGLEVGFATRTVKDCRRLMEEDITILTSLIDCRHLAGDLSLFEEFQKMFQQYFSSKKNQENYFQKKMAENLERRGKYGGSVYLLEPNLKEGEGGLRDYHTLYWLARVFEGVKKPQDLVTRKILTAEEFELLWKALTFLWTIRTELHRRADRRVDQLLFEYQEPVAVWAGFQNSAQFLGVELFMQKYYAQAEIIRRLSHKAIRRLRPEIPVLFPAARVPFEDRNFRVVEGRLTTATPDLFEEPLALLKIFDIARRLEMELDDFALEQIEKNLHRIDDNFRTAPAAAALFRELLKNPRGLGEMLGRMNQAGVLGAYLPEFKKLHFRVQHDLYHVYTVDVHSIFAAGEFGKLAAGAYAKTLPALTELAQEVAQPDLLAFAILYHDIGKGEGRGHVEKGAPLIRQAGARLGFSATEMDTLEFLERSHLIMTHLAFRRDLEDQNLIIQFAKSCQNLEQLNQLYLLTVCDVRGVSSEAMTGWKSSLLEFLYLKTREVIRKGAFTPERASTLIPKIREEVLQRQHNEKDQQAAEEFFKSMPARYLLGTAPAVICHHLKLWQKLKFDRIVFEARVLKKEALNEVTLITLDSPALFSKIAGLFTAHALNILTADLAISRQGYALHLFWVTDHNGLPTEETEKWARVEQDLRAILTGKIRIEDLVAEKFTPSLFKKKVARILPTRIDIDNDVSAYYTVIDVTTHDRIGLLYQITSTLTALGLYVDVSKVSTKVDQVADTFYVKDIFGHKITDAERLKRVKEILFKVIETEPTPGWKAPTT